MCIKLFLNCIILNLFLLSGCVTTQFPRLDIPKSEPSAKQFDHFQPRVALVLGSGSAKGFSHVGVIKALEKNHIPIDLIVGTSAGSIVGALYADNPSSHSLRHLLFAAERNEVIDFSIFNVRSGPVSGAGLQSFLVRHMYAITFDQLQIPFVAVALDLQSGKIHAFKSGPIAPAVNASSAVPPFFRPVKIYGKTYVDGGIVDPVAVDVAKQFHPKIIIAVSLDSALSKRIPSSSPSVLIKGISMMLASLNENTARDADVVIRPKLGDVDMFEFGARKRAELMRAGEIATEKALPTIKKLLAEKS